MSALLNWSVANAPVCAAISAALRIMDGIRSGVMPSGLGISSTSAPNACIVRIFSSANASEDTIRNGYPFTAQTNASDDPVLPPVYSTTSWPGRRRPSASAASIIARAIRSLYEPVGLAASIFTQTSAPPSPARRPSRTTGVPPMAEIPPRRSTQQPPSSAAQPPQRTATAGRLAPGPGASAEDQHAAGPPSRAQRVECVVQLFEPDAAGDELVEQQVPGQILVGQRGHVALQVGRPEIAAPDDLL